MGGGLVRGGFTYVKKMEPGHILSSTTSAIAGFLLGSSGDFEYILFYATIASVLLLTAAGIMGSKLVDEYYNRESSTTKPLKYAGGIIRFTDPVCLGTLGLLGLLITFLYIDLLAIAALSIGGALHFGLSGYMGKHFPWGRYFTNVPHAFIVLYGYLAVTKELNYESIALFVVVAVFYILMHVAMLRSLLGFASTK